MTNLTQEQLKALLNYNPRTGVFRWRVRRTPVISKGQVAGSVNAWGYGVICINNVQYRAHRLAWLYVYGKWPDGPLDHINQNPLDNRISNIRMATPRENKRNCYRQSNNTSGHTGVVFHSVDGRWLARIVVNRKAIHLGRFKNKEDAVAARKKAEKDYGFYKNHGRPREDAHV